MNGLERVNWQEVEVSGWRSSPEYDLPAFKSSEYEDHVSAWIQAAQEMSDRQWRLSAVAHSLVTRILRRNKRAVKGFAGEVGVSAATVYSLARAYELRVQHLEQRSQTEVAEIEPEPDREDSTEVEPQLETSSQLEVSSQPEFLTPTHYAEASYADDPITILETAEAEGWSAQTLRYAVKEEKREKERSRNRELVASAKPIEAQTFKTIVLDPPWDWGDEGDVDQLGRARPTYSTMSFEDLLKLPVPDLAEENAHIYLWITNRSLPKGFRLLEAWGFRYITALTWVKPQFGQGNYFRGASEHMLFGVRGSLPLLRKDVPTWFSSSRGSQHSQKPEAAYELIESCSPGPWLEMFARSERPGWKVWGAEV